MKVFHTNAPLILVCLLSIAAEASSSPQVHAKEKSLISQENLSGRWSFAYTPSHTGTIPEPRAFRASMPVPGCWDDFLNRAEAKALWPQARFNPDYIPFSIPTPGSPPDASLPYLLGTGWYRRALEVPIDWRERTVTLHAGRVVMEAWLYVNGRQVYHHLGHSTPWSVSLAPYLNFGETNEIVLAVDNTRADRLGCVIRGWKGHSGGIFGPVFLKIAGAVRIADLYLHPHDGKIHWRVSLERGKLDDSTLRWKVYGAESGKLFGQGSEPVSGAAMRWKTGTLGIPMWSDREPILVMVEAALWSGQVCLDRIRQPFGLRLFTREGKKLLLNGEPVYLRGICDCAYFPETCTPPMEVEWYRGHIKRLKEVGFNWIRFHTWVPKAYVLQVWEDGQWKDIPGTRVRNNGAFPIEHRFEPVQTAKVRLLITETGTGVFSKSRGEAAKPHHNAALMEMVVE